MYYFPANIADIGKLVKDAVGDATSKAREHQSEAK
jgi:hypothetical protein